MPMSAELEKRTQAFEMRCYRRLLNILYKDHIAIGEYDELLTLVKTLELKCFDHVSRSSGLTKMVQDTVKGKRNRGKQKKRWTEWILPAKLGQLKTG